MTTLLYEMLENPPKTLHQAIKTYIYAYGKVDIINSFKCLVLEQRIIKYLLKCGYINVIRSNWIDDVRNKIDIKAQRNGIEYAFQVKTVQDYKKQKEYLIQTMERIAEKHPRFKFKIIIVSNNRIYFKNINTKTNAVKQSKSND